ncbi:MAG: TQO small subunit DoxD [Pseudonocardiales bacterium]|nr:MAG: TQO small subunit DoxD [Pseudonocardiales bacterium]
MTIVLKKDSPIGEQGGGIDSRMSRGIIVLARVGLAFLWIQNVSWKSPGDNFGKDSGGGLYGYTVDAVTHPVFSPYASFVKHVVLPNYTFFAWMTLVIEASLGAFLLVGLASRFFALVGVVQSTAIMLSVLNVPGEWHWSFYLLIIGHLFLFATAAGRVGGLDGLLRPRWLASRRPLARLLRLAS